MTRKARLSYHAVPRILPGDQDELRHCFYGDDGQKVLFDTNGSIDKVDNVIDSNCSTSAEDDPYSDKSDKSAFCIDNDFGSTEFTNEPVIVTPTVKGNKCSIQELSELMENVVANDDWEGFQKYLNISRVNVNVRQVLKDGMELSTCPDVIQTCQKSCGK